MCVTTKSVYKSYIAQSPELQDTSTASLQRGKTSPKSVLDITLNNLMMRLQ